MPTNDALDPAQLPAGPALDAKIEQLVFHGSVYRRDGHWRRVIPEGQYVGLEIIPPYSTSIEAAWLIVEAFPSCCFHVDRESAAGIRYDVTIIMDGEQPYDHGREIHATAATAPLAICRAALSAVSPVVTTDSSPR
jgi:hypothetical protein